MGQELGTCKIPTPDVLPPLLLLPKITGISATQKFGVGEVTEVGREGQARGKPCPFHIQPNPSSLELRNSGAVHDGVLLPCGLKSLSPRLAPTDVSDSPCIPQLCWDLFPPCQRDQNNLAHPRAGGWLALLAPQQSCARVVRCWRNRRNLGSVGAQQPSGDGHGLLRSLGHSLEQNLPLSSGSHGHQHLAEVF